MWQRRSGGREQGASGSVPFQLFSLIDAPTGCEPAAMLKGHNETIHSLCRLQGAQSDPV